ncbi:hypothetical protein XELAEV_18003493mg [Xenopus laevis]|nr:hypothetical protein XELAEV_18003493mg [Xenopus laevis]
MSSKANGKTYERINRKNGKQQDSDTNNTSLSHKSASSRPSLSEDYSLIAAELARLLNPVIEATIEKAIDKFQSKISEISVKLSAHDKRFGEIENTVSQIQDETFDSITRIEKEFSKTCQSLANLHIKFSLMYPAKLKNVMPSGARIFSDPREAYAFVSLLEKKSFGKFPSDSAPNLKDGPSTKDQRVRRYENS